MRWLVVHRINELLVRLIRGKSCLHPQQMGQDFPQGVLAAELSPLLIVLRNDPPSSQRLLVVIFPFAGPFRQLNLC